MSRIVVAGGNGMLGSTLVPELRSRGHDVSVLARGEGAQVRADLNDPADTRRSLDRAAPDVIVNLAALTNVDACERDPALAFEYNAQSVRNIVEWIGAGHDAVHLVQVSTDQVYDGAGPHEEGRVRPINYYAYSKLAGELYASQAAAAVIRTNLVGRSRRSGRTSMSDWLVNRLREGVRTEVFADVLFSPLSMETLSSILAQVVEKRVTGTFNLGSHDGMSKADFAFRLADRLGLSPQPLVRGVSTSAALSARRPSDMRMDCSLLEARLGIVLPTLESEIHMMGNSYESRS